LAKEAEAGAAVAFTRNYKDELVGSSRTH